MSFMSKADSEKLKENADTFNAVVTSSDDRTPPASDGKTKLTLAGFEKALTDAVAEAGRVFKATYNSDPLIEKVNEYVTYDRSGVEEKYSVKGDTALPYQINSAATPDPKNDTNLQSVGEITEGQLYNAAPKPYQAGETSVVGQNYLYDGDAHFTALTAATMPASPYGAGNQFRPTFGELPYKEGELTSIDYIYRYQPNSGASYLLRATTNNHLMGAEPTFQFMGGDFETYPTKRTVPEIIKVSADASIDNTAPLHVGEGAGFDIDANVVLTVDAEICAGYYQIFYGDGEALPTYLKTDTAPDKRSKTERVKIAWFGVKGDVFVPGNYGSSLPAAQLGDVPTGTDSTAEFKKAVKFVEWGAMHGSKFLVQRSRMTLVGTPNTSILLKGDGLIQQQAEAANVAAVYTLADSGQDIFGTPALEACKFTDWQFDIDMQDGHIFWQPLTASDQFVKAEFLLNRCLFRRMRMTPCGITSGQMGVFFHNRSATVYNQDGSVKQWVNSLGWPTFIDCEISFGELNPPQLGTYAPQIGIDKGFLFTGFGRGDRPTFSRCIFTQFKTLIRNENSQAVEVNFDSGCEIRSQIDEAIFFDYTSFAGQLKAEGTGIFLKGANQTLIRTAKEDNRSDFTDAAEFTFQDIRMEGGVNSHTLLDMEAGRLNLARFTHNYAMPNASAIEQCNMILRGRAELYAESCALPGRIDFIDYDTDKSQSVPAIDFNGVRLSDADGLDKVTFTRAGETNSMPRAISKGWELPLVSMMDTPTIYGADVIPCCPLYGGQGALGGNTREVVLTNPSHTVNEAEFYLPSFCVVESIKLTRRSTDTTQFKTLKITVGSQNLAETQYDFPSNDGQYLAEVLPSTTFLTVPTNDKTKRKLTFNVLNASGTEVSGGPLMTVTLRYRSLMWNSECPNSGLQSDAEFITL